MLDIWQQYCKMHRVTTASGAEALMQKVVSKYGTFGQDLVDKLEKELNAEKDADAQKRGYAVVNEEPIHSMEMANVKIELWEAFVGGIVIRLYRGDTMLHALLFEDSPLYNHHYYLEDNGSSIDSDATAHVKVLVVDGVIKESMSELAFSLNVTKDDNVYNVYTEEWTEDFKDSLGFRTAGY